MAPSASARPSAVDRARIALVLAVLLGAAGLGAIRGGQLNSFVADHGGIGDVIARKVGFGVDMVTVSGATHLSEARILALAGISSKSSLLFFDVSAARARLEADPLVKQASVRKLYPNQIVVDIVERTPYGVWQKDGDVRAIAADGAPIDAMHDGRYVDLPFVVGEGANQRIREFVGLLNGLAELKPRGPKSRRAGRSARLQLLRSVEQRRIFAQALVGAIADDEGKRGEAPSRISAITAPSAAIVRTSPSFCHSAYRRALDDVDDDLVGIELAHARLLDERQNFERSRAARRRRTEASSSG